MSEYKMWLLGLGGGINGFGFNYFQQMCFL